MSFLTPIAKRGQGDGQSTFEFEGPVNYETDYLCLKDSDNTHMLNPVSNTLEYAVEKFPDLLEPVQKLVVRVGEHSQMHFIRNWESACEPYLFWDLLEMNCPDLKELYLGLFDHRCFMDNEDPMLETYMSNDEITEFFQDIVEGLEKAGRFTGVKVYLEYLNHTKLPAEYWTLRFNYSNS